MKTTAVQWLVDQLEKYEDYSKISYRCLGEIEIALEMEKEQIEESYKDGSINFEDAEQFQDELGKFIVEAINEKLNKQD